MCVVVVVDDDDDIVSFDLDCTITASWQSRAAAQMRRVDWMGAVLSARCLTSW